MTFVELPVTRPLGPISALSFPVPADDSLLVASYDNTVNLYNCERKNVSATLDSPSAVLSLAYSSFKTTFTGLSDGTIRHIDFENMAFSRPIIDICSERLSLNHNSTLDTNSSGCSSVSNGINCLVPLDTTTFVASAYNGTLVLFDPRSSQVATKQHTSSKIFAMDAFENTITLAKSRSTVEIYDARKLMQPVKSRSTGLQFPVTHLQNLPSHEGYTLSGIDGRVFVEYYDDSPQEQAKKFAFKCHRIRDKVTCEDSVYPVVGLKFHPIHQTLFTAGGDGNVCVWNWVKRKRMKLFDHGLELPRAISKMDLSSDGAFLAISVGDDSFMRAKNAESGDVNKGSKLLIKRLSEADCKPKS